MLGSPLLVLLSLIALPAAWPSTEYAHVSFPACPLSFQWERGLDGRSAMVLGTGVGSLDASLLLP